MFNSLTFQMLHHFFWDKVRCVPGWPWPPYIVENDLQLQILLSHLPTAGLQMCTRMLDYRCAPAHRIAGIHQHTGLQVCVRMLDYRCAPTHLVLFGSGMKPRTSWNCKISWWSHIHNLKWLLLIRSPLPCFPLWLPRKENLIYKQFCQACYSSQACYSPTQLQWTFIACYDSYIP